MKNDRLGANVLSMEVIPSVDPALAREPLLKSERRSLGIIASDCDDVTYVALDEATRVADVTVVYGKGVYVGAADASAKSASEVIGVIAGLSPAEVNSGLSVITQVIEGEASFYSVSEDDSIVYFAHIVSRTSSFSSEQTNIPEGEAVAYLVAPPLGAMVGLDAAVRAADIRMDVFYGPLSETDLGGALLTGSRSVCKAVCSAFERVTQSIADNPLSYQGCDLNESIRNGRS